MTNSISFAMAVILRTMLQFAGPLPIIGLSEKLELPIKEHLSYYYFDT